MQKKGISLIVLVITIIVMIILAAAVVISLNNTGIINRANEAVDSTNTKQVEQIVSLAWAEAYASGERDVTKLQEAVDKALQDNNINKDQFDIVVTDKGVTVGGTDGGGNTISTLGELITGPEDYGKTVDYSVTLGNEEYKEWQVFYEDEENGYVFIISTDGVWDGYLESRINPSEMTEQEKELYKKFQLNNEDAFQLTDNIYDQVYGGFSPAYNCQYIAGWIREGVRFAQTTESYSPYVEGALMRADNRIACCGVECEKLFSRDNVCTSDTRI
ncbi:MAG: type II secretion system protein [Clostridia bacterium]|nr:type II secretion system protein [Clostridia bacterium]